MASADTLKVPRACARARGLILPSRLGTAQCAGALFLNSEQNKDRATTRGDLVREMIDELRDLEDSIGIQMVERFKAVLSANLAPGAQTAFRSTPLEARDDLEKLWKGRGFYIILTNRRVGENLCTYAEGDLRVIYRGHADKVFERVSSHLDRTLYEKTVKLPWDQCMKIPDGERPKGGINFHESPFRESLWAVKVLPLPGSTAFIRKHAEYAFDTLFNKPVASARERSKRRI